MCLSINGTNKLKEMTPEVGQLVITMQERIPFKQLAKRRWNSWGFYSDVADGTNCSPGGAGSIP
jgi:hypothetical protein